MGRSGAGKTTLVESLCLSELVQDLCCSGCQDMHAYASSFRLTLWSAFAVSSSAPDSQSCDTCCSTAPQLDILAANASGGRLAGDVLLNGSPRRMTDYRKLSCYVMQRDVLLESATVREHQHQHSACTCLRSSKQLEARACSHASVPPELRLYVIVQAPVMCRERFCCRCGRR